MAQEVRKMDTQALATELARAVFAPIAEAKQVDAARIASLKAFLANHKPEEADEALRGASKEERAAGQKLAPFVAAALKMGVSEASARVYLSQYRAIVKAVHDDNVKLSIPDDVATVDALYAMATEKLGTQRKTAKLEVASIQAGAKMAQAAAKLGIRLTDDNGRRAHLTAEQHAQIDRQIEVMDAEQAERDAKAEYVGKMRAVLDEVFTMWNKPAKNDKGEDVMVPDRERNLQFARDVIQGLQTRINIVEKAMADAASKAQEGAAETSPAPVESMAGEQQRSTQAA